MYVPIIIPTRMESERVKEKPLVEILNRPSIFWTSQEMLKSKKASEVIVCSNDTRIVKSVNELNIKTIETIQKYRNGTEMALCEALKLKTRPQFLVVVDCGEILVKSQTIDSLIELSTSSKCDIITCVGNAIGVEIADINVVKVVLSSENDIIYFSRAPVPFSKKIKPMTIGFWKHIGVTCYKFETIKHFISSEICEVEDIEDVDLIRALNCGIKIKALKVNYRTIGLNCSKNISEISEELSSNRVSTGKMVNKPKFLN